MECPSCRASLVKKHTEYGFAFICPRCRGRSVTLPVLRKAGAAREFLADVWQRSRAKGVTPRRPCPLCGRTMAEVKSSVAGERLTLDVCPACPAIWFDHAEFESVPRKPPPPGPSEKPAMTQEAREKLAILQVQKISEDKRQEAVTYGPDETWQWLPGLLGLPVELDAPKVSQTPWVTWGVIVICVATIFLTLSGSDPRPIPTGDSIFERWGFIPDQAPRYGGLTLITSFFIHAGFFHLLGNMYFLFVFGDNVEDRLGHVRYVLLLLLAHAAGMLAQALFGPDPDVPCVGASAGISGVIAYYAIAFPRVRLAFMFRYFLYFRWFRMSAAWALVLYVLLQLAGAYAQINGFGSVSYLGHLGGLGVGLCTGVLYRHHRKREAARAIGPLAE